MARGIALVYTKNDECQNEMEAVSYLSYIGADACVSLEMDNIDTFVDRCGFETSLFFLGCSRILPKQFWVILESHTFHSANTVGTIS